MHEVCGFNPSRYSGWQGGDCENRRALRKFGFKVRRATKESGLTASTRVKRRGISGDGAVTSLKATEGMQIMRECNKFLAEGLAPFCCN